MASSQTKKQDALCADCGVGPGVVGLGKTPRWICLACFRASLQKTRRVVDAAIAAAESVRE